MTSIDFHTNVTDVQNYICRLARKAYAAGQAHTILVADQTSADALDHALWQTGEADFLPHAQSQSTAAHYSPVIITCDERYNAPQHLLLINASNRIPRIFARYQRMIEIVGQDTDAAASGRTRFRHYRDQGYSLTHHIA